METKNRPQTTLSDEAFDALIAETFDREETLAALNKSIMRDVRQAHRRTVWLRCLRAFKTFGRVAAVSFGVPVAAAWLLFVAYRVADAAAFAPVMIAAMGLYAVSVVAIAYQMVRRFLMNEV